NLALIEWVAAYLHSFGIASHLSGDRDGKANLFATMGPHERGGVILSGHTDTVPGEGQPWDSDPFRLTERPGDGGERLYARGSADMKGFIALALALVPDAVSRSLAVPLHLALTHDEETGCLGAPSLIRALPHDLTRPA